MAEGLPGSSYTNMTISQIDVKRAGNQTWGVSMFFSSDLSDLICLLKSLNPGFNSNPEDF